MQIKQLEYLLKIVECGSITQAAKQLYVSQPNLTKAVRQLEDEYGIEIFVRKPRGVELTMAGKNFVYYAKSILTAVQALSNNCNTEKEVPYSRLALAAQQLDFVYDIFLKVYLNYTAMPIHYNLLETDRDDVVSQVLKGDVNCGIFVRNTEDAKTFRWNTDAKRLSMRLLDTGGPYVCVGPKSRYYQNEYITEQEAETNTQVMLDMENAARRDLYFDNSNLSSVHRDHIIFFSTVDACKRFILQTDSVLYLSKWSRGYFEYPRFRILPLLNSQTGKILTTNELIWVQRQDTPLSKAENLFLEYLLQYLEHTL